jgi:hypothetical protein
MVAERPRPGPSGADAGRRQAPLAELRPEIGAAGWAAFRSDTYRRRLTVTFLVGLAVSIFMTIPSQVLGRLL